MPKNHEQSKIKRWKRAGAAGAALLSLGELTACTTDAAPQPTVTVTATETVTASPESTPDTISDEQRRRAADIVLDNLLVLAEKLGGEDSVRINPEGSISIGLYGNPTQSTIVQKNPDGSRVRNFSGAYITTEASVDGGYTIDIGTDDSYPVEGKDGKFVPDEYVTDDMNGHRLSNESTDHVTLSSAYKPDLSSLPAFVASLQGNASVEEFYGYDGGYDFYTIPETPEGLQLVVDEIAKI